MKASNRIWIVVADASRAKIVEYKGPDAPLEIVPDGEFEHPNLATRDLVTDNQGRGFANPASNDARSAMEPQTDPQAYEEFRFLGRVAQFIDSQAQQFDELVIAAAPKALGLLRKQLPGKVQDKVRAEINKEFTNLPLGDLRKRLQGVININA